MPTSYKSMRMKTAVYIKEELIRETVAYKEALKHLERKGAYIPEGLHEPWASFPVPDVKLLVEELPRKRSNEELLQSLKTLNFIRAMKDFLKEVQENTSLLSILQKAGHGSELTPDDIMTVARSLTDVLEYHDIGVFLMDTTVNSIVMDLSVKKGLAFDVTINDEKSLNIIRSLLSETLSSYVAFSASENVAYLTGYTGRVAYIVGVKYEASHPFSLLPGINKHYFLTNNNNITIRFKGVLPVTDTDKGVDSYFNTVEAIKTHEIYSTRKTDWSMRLNGGILKWLINEKYDIDLYSTGTLNVSDSLIVDDRFIVNGKQLILEWRSPKRKEYEEVVEAITFNSKRLVYHELKNMLDGPILLEKTSSRLESALLLKPSNTPFEVLVKPDGYLVSITNSSKAYYPEPVWRPRRSIMYFHSDLIPLKASSDIRNAYAYLFNNKVLVKMSMLHGSIVSRVKNPSTGEIVSIMEGIRKNITTGSVNALFIQKRKVAGKVKARILEDLHPLITNTYNTSLPVYLIEGGSYAGRLLSWTVEKVDIVPFFIPGQDTVMLGEGEFKIRVPHNKLIRPVIEFDRESVKVRIADSYILPIELNNAPVVSELETPDISVVIEDGLSFDGYALSPLILYSMSRKRVLTGRVVYGLDMMNKAVHVIISIGDKVFLDYKLRVETVKNYNI